MGYFDDIDFEEESHEKIEDRDKYINDLLRRRERKMSDLDLETIDDVLNYLLEKRNHKRALSYIDSLLDFFPYSNEIWQRKAIIYDGISDYRHAVECFDKAISL